MVKLLIDLQKYISIIEKWHRDENKIMSYFELNLETWRQLWRVLEISDIVLIIVDIRYPVNDNCTNQNPFNSTDVADFNVPSVVV